MERRAFDKVAAWVCVACACLLLVLTIVGSHGGSFVLHLVLETAMLVLGVVWLRQVLRDA